MDTSISCTTAAPAEFEKRIHKALRYWNQRRQDDGLLTDLLLAQPIVRQNPLCSQRQITNAVLEQGMQRLREQNCELAELLHLRFCHSLELSEIRRVLNYAESTLYARQNKAIAALARILHSGEIALRQQRAGEFARRIDLAPACPPLGIAEQVAALTGLLVRRGPPYLISIEGVGGIGKTTLAAALLREGSLSLAFDDCGWLSAQPAALDGLGGIRCHPQPALTTNALITGLARQLAPDAPAALLASPERALHLLRERLQHTPHLIVIDNLETVLDLQMLLPVLRALANPSKFVLTSRLRLCCEPGIYLHAVPELDEPTALQVVRQAARYHGLTGLAEADDAALHPIYAAVGGNPLALLLVVGQAHVRPLQAILADLSHTSRHEPSEAWETLFCYIYRQAWEGLRQADRHVLLALCATQATELDAEALALLCGLDEATITAALQRLIQANLVAMQGDLNTSHYRVNRLTYRFVQGWAAQWLAAQGR